MTGAMHARNKKNDPATVKQAKFSIGKRRGSAKDAADLESPYKTGAGST